MEANVDRRSWTANALRLLAAWRISRYPGRYLEIFRIIRRHRLHEVLVELGLVSLYHEDGTGPVFADEKDSAEQLASALEELGPFFIKLGQLLSTRPDLMPPNYITALSRLQSRIHPVPAETVVGIVEQELKAPVATLFQTFDLTPVATASMAQVHRATLPDGTDVAVKVLRPGVRRQTQIDLVVLREMIRFARRRTRIAILGDLEQMLREMEESLAGDMDFQLEMQNTRRLGRQLEGFARLTTPQVFPRYCTGRVLTVSFIHGRPLAAVSPEEITAFDGAAMAKDLLEAYFKQIVVDGAFHCDPHPGNILITDDGRLALFDFGMVGRLDAGEKDNIIQLLLAFAGRQGDRIADIYLDMIDVPDHFNRHVFDEEVSSFVSRYNDMSGGKMGLGTAFLDLLRLADTLNMPVPSSLTLLSKAMFNLDGIVSVLSPELDPVALIQDYMLTVMRERLAIQSHSPANYAWGMDVWRLLEQGPRQVHTVLQRLAGPGMKVRLDVAGMERVSRNLDRLSTSIVVGSAVVAAGYLLGALLRNRDRLDD